MDTRRKALSCKSSERPAKPTIVFHVTSWNDWYAMALALGDLWRNCGKRRWTAGFAPRSKHLINRLEHKQQLQFVLACGAVCHGRNGNQAASSSQGAFEHGSSALPKTLNAHRGDHPTSFCRVGAQSLDLFWRWSPCASRPEVATHNRVAVLIHAIGEVLARHAEDAALPPLQVALVNEISVPHKPS